MEFKKGSKRNTFTPFNSSVLFFDVIHLFHSPNNYPVYFDSAINSVVEEALKMHLEITYQFKQ